jgi:hypothetical protein
MGREIGFFLNVKPEALADPKELVMETEPEVPDPTMAFITDEFTTVNEVEDVPPKLT